MSIDIILMKLSKLLLSILLTTIVSISFPLPTIANTKQSEVTLPIPVTVYKTLDGDTIRVIIAGEKKYLRLCGIDAPEVAKTVKQATLINPISILQYRYGNEAKFYLESILPVGKVIDIKIKSTDKYGRLIAEVYDTNKSVQEDLIIRGLAQVYPTYYKQCSNSIRLLELQEQAKLNKEGIWKEQEFLAPWLFRKQY